MSKDGAGAADRFLKEHLQPDTALQERRVDDGPAFKRHCRTKSKARAPSTPQRPVAEPLLAELPAATELKDVPPSGSEAATKSLFRRRPFALVAAVLFFGTALAGSYLYWDYAGHFQSTDDAFIVSRQIAIAPKVSGYVTQVSVTDNQHVPAGGVIARIDDRDYRIALEQADDQEAAAQAAIKNIDAQIATQEAQINASLAQVEQAQAGLTFAKQQSARYEHLAGSGYGTVQNAQQYGSQLLQQQATLKNAQAALNVAQRQTGSLKAQRGSAEANLKLAAAQGDQAKLNLSYTIVTTAVPGRVVNLSAEPGEFVQPGTNLTSFVPDEIWVTANFKETQLDHIRSGEPVVLTIDAYPERQIHGHVASVQPGSGTAFSLLPAQNATGNYVKIVQRVPVKIVIDDPPNDIALGPGMSVEPTVRVNPELSLCERFFSTSKTL